MIVDPASGQIKQRVQLPADDQRTPLPASANILRPDKEGQVSYTGLIFSPDGRRIYLSNVDGSLKVFSVAAQGQVSPSHTIPLPEANAPRRKEEIPSGLALSGDGSKLYVCGNLSNRLLELDTQTGNVLRTFDVGVAPYDVVLAGGKAFVSNWGGRRPTPGVLTGPAGRGTQSPRRSCPAHRQRRLGVDRRPRDREARGRAAHRSARLCARGFARRRLRRLRNAGSDHLSRDRRRPRNGRRHDVGEGQARPILFGRVAQRAGVRCFRPKPLFVANGTQNAVAVCTSIRTTKATRSSKA